MIVKLGNDKYIVTWHHIDDATETDKFVTAHPELQRKPGRYVGMTACRILQPGDDGKKMVPLLDGDGSPVVGYAFRHKSEKTFNKATARRRSLENTLYTVVRGFQKRENSRPTRYHKPIFTEEFRKAIWTKYNATWPPTDPQMSTWQRRYLKVAMENTELRELVARTADRIQTLTGRLEAVVPSGGAHTPSADGTGFPD